MLKLLRNLLLLLTATIGKLGPLSRTWALTAAILTVYLVVGAIAVSVEGGTIWAIASWVVLQLTGR